VVQFLANQETRERMVQLGMRPFDLDAPAAWKWIAQERQRYAALVKASGFVPEER
jgi:tripartite-type tricarboxylate transporter receptor subunit TctC